MKLSVVIPVYNEINTIDAVLNNVAQALPATAKEIIIVDDCSTDGTREWLSQHCENGWVNIQALQALTPCVDAAAHSLQVKVAQTSATTFRLIQQPCNQGKGAALRKGFSLASGDVIVIQDADLEYDPQDWTEMWGLIAENRADVVYGSRFYGKPHRVLYFHHFLGNKSISTLMNILCNTTLSDIEVCYKMFRREVLDDIVLTCNGFGFEVEFSIKVTRSPRRWRFYEVGVSYYGRTYEEGKKINWRDGLRALWLVVWFAVKS